MESLVTGHLRWALTNRNPSPDLSEDWTKRDGITTPIPARDTGGELESGCVIVISFSQISVSVSNGSPSRDALSRYKTSRNQLQIKTLFLTYHPSIHNPIMTVVPINSLSDFNDIVGVLICLRFMSDGCIDNIDQFGRSRRY